MFSNTFRSYKSDPSKTKREGVISGKAVFRNKHHWLPKEGKNRVYSPYRNSWVMNLGGLSKDQDGPASISISLLIEELSVLKNGGQVYLYKTYTILLLLLPNMCQKEIWSLAYVRYGMKRFILLSSHYPKVMTKLRAFFLLPFSFYLTSRNKNGYTIGEGTVKW